MAAHWIDLVSLDGWGGTLDGRIGIGVGRNQGDCFGGRWSRVLFLDVVDARTVSSSELFVSFSSGFFLLPVWWVSVLFSASVAMPAIASSSSFLVFVVGGCDNRFFCQWRHLLLLQWAMASSLEVVAAMTTIVMVGSVLNGGGYFGNDGIARDSGCVTVGVHDISRTFSYTFLFS